MLVVVGGRNKGFGKVEGKKKSCFKGHPGRARRRTLSKRAAKKARGR